MAELGLVILVVLAAVQCQPPTADAGERVIISVAPREAAATRCWWSILGMKGNTLITHSKER